MTSPLFTIRRTAESDWRHVRDLRIEMIRDTPNAYAESLEQALVQDEAEWRRRSLRGTAENSICLVGIAASGRWVATMAAFVPDDATGALLVGVYVAPDFRGVGIGLTDALLGAIEGWACTQSSTLTLHVHESNLRAQKAYERWGFRPTGETVAYNLNPDETEIVMAKSL